MSITAHTPDLFTRFASAIHMPRATIGYSVKEMIGYGYWTREGYQAEDDQCRIERATDELTARLGSISCDC